MLWLILGGGLCGGRDGILGGFAGPTTKTTPFAHRRIELEVMVKISWSSMETPLMMP